eukprot:1746000-Rhodomonas_salina.1
MAGKDTGARFRGVAGERCGAGQQPATYPQGCNSDHEHEAGDGDGQVADGMLGDAADETGHGQGGGAMVRSGRFGSVCEVA